MDHSFLSAFILLLLVLDPLGSLPVFIPIMRSVPRERRRSGPHTSRLSSSSVKPAARRASLLKGGRNRGAP
jgi:small neutral amino acid transporter SnatA (MarC family)